LIDSADLRSMPAVETLRVWQLLAPCHGECLASVIARSAGDGNPLAGAGLPKICFATTPTAMT